MRVPSDIDPALGDFRNFLYLAWKALRLPNPTELQYDVADWMQTEYGAQTHTGEDGLDRMVILAFRGFGKSWIVSIFGCWRLLMDPQRKFLNTSASAGKSDQATRFMLSMIKLMPELQHLIPGPDQRFGNSEFDVAGALPAHAPSVLSLGISSNLLQGSRCDDFCADDVESKKNSQTPMMQDRVRETCKEFGGSIQRSSDEVDDPKGIYLGTPQIEESLYFKLEEAGYRVIIYPARYPDPQTNKIYDGRLAPILQRRLDADPRLADQPTEPGRFSEEVLQKKFAEYGRQGWLLQFMLMPHLANEDRFPLKLNDCPVMDLDYDMGPMKVIWEDTTDKRVDDLPCVGFSRDWWHAPAACVGGYRPYERRVMSIDPAGAGADECAFTVVFGLASQLFLMDVGGFKAGNSEETFERLAVKAKEWGVTKVVIEENWGDGMWAQLFKPVLRRICPEGCRVEEVRVKGRKELRMIDVLDPPFDSHRVIINKSAIRNDYESTQSYSKGTLSFQLMYQISRLTSDVNSLEHDDRLDALSLAVAHFAGTMSRDYADEIKRRDEEELDDMIRQWDRDVAEFGVGAHSRPSTRTWMNH